jgi:hypothetical protein
VVFHYLAHNNINLITSSIYDGYFTLATEG